MGLPVRSGLTLVCFHVTSILFESIGIAMLLPIAQYIQNNQSMDVLVDKYYFWKTLLKITQSVGVDINLSLLLLITFAAIILRQSATFLRLSYMALVQFRLISNIRNRLFCALLRTNINQQEKIQSGDAINLMMTEITRGVGAVFSIIVQIGYISLLIIYTLFLLLLSPNMTLVSIAICGIGIISIRRLFRRTQVLGEQLTTVNTSLSLFLVQRLKAMRLIRLSAMENAEEIYMKKLSNNQEESSVRLNIALAKIEVILEPIIVGLGLAFLYTGISFFHLSIEEVGLFLLIVMRILPVLKEALRSRQAAIGALPALITIYEKIETLNTILKAKGDHSP